MTLLDLLYLRLTHDALDDFATLDHNVASDRSENKIRRHHSIRQGVSDIAARSYACIEISKGVDDLKCRAYFHQYTRLCTLQHHLLASLSHAHRSSTTLGPDAAILDSPISSYSFRRVHAASHALSLDLFYLASSGSLWSQPAWRLHPLPPWDLLRIDMT
jgi:hypothetical protein